MKIPFVDRNTATNQLIQFSILFYWSLFWLFNIVDKVIGGSMFLWVGRDRFAQFQKFFASAGLESPWIADFALIIAAGLEVFAFVFFLGCTSTERSSSPITQHSAGTMIGNIS